MDLRRTLARFAHRPDDTQEVTNTKVLIFVVALSCCLCGGVWSAMYAAVFGVGLTMMLPLGFVVVVGLSLVVSGKIRDARPAIYAQLACITWISALIQWSIGSSTASGLVICWSFLGPLGALMFLTFRQALVWMAMFIVIVVVSVTVEPALQGRVLSVSPSLRRAFLLMNLGTATIVVFAAAAWFVRTIQRTLRELKEAQAQLIDSEKQAMVGRLASGLLHEINTPLGALQSSASTLSLALRRCAGFFDTHQGDETKEMRRAARAAATAPQLAEVVESSVERLRAVASGLGRFVSLDEATKKPVDVCESLDTALMLMSDTLGSRIKIDKKYEPNIPRIVCHGAKLNQVFFSILENATQAIEDQGQICIHVSCETGAVAVDISDTGRGMAPEQLQHVFDIGLSNQAGRVGMQLGLPMSKRHLDEMGGSIEIESVQGQGTNVRIVLSSE